MLETGGESTSGGELDKMRSEDDKERSYVSSEGRSEGQVSRVSVCGVCARTGPKAQVY